MPTIGNIVEDGKLLVPVYVEGEGSSSSGEGSTTIIPTSTLGLTGGFYSGTFYGMALGSDGRLTTFSWNRSGNPVVISNGLSLPISGNPTATGYMVYNEISSDINMIHITQTSDTITSGKFIENLSVIYNYRLITSDPSKKLKIQLKNDTSKNLIISLKLDGPWQNAYTSGADNEEDLLVSCTLNSNETGSILSPEGWNNSSSTNTTDSHTCTFTFQVLN